MSASLFTTDQLFALMRKTHFPVPEHFVKLLKYVLQSHVTCEVVQNSMTRVCDCKCGVFCTVREKLRLVIGSTNYSFDLPICVFRNQNHPQRRIWTLEIWRIDRYHGAIWGRKIQFTKYSLRISVSINSCLV